MAASSGHLLGDLASKVKRTVMGGITEENATRNGRVWATEVFSVQRWTILMAPIDSDLIVGLHFTNCRVKDLPDAAFRLAEKRLSTLRF